MIAKTAIARTLVLTAVLFGLTACPPPPPSGKIQPGSTGTTNGAILFGDTYVGQSSVRTLRIDEIDNAAVDIIGSLVDGNDSHAFARMGAGPLSVRVPASGSVNVQLQFTPDEARFFGDAEFSVFTSFNSIGFPVILRGNGVFNKSTGPLHYGPAGTRDNEPLDFGTLQIGQSTDRFFLVRNSSNQPMTVTLAWVSSDPAFRVSSSDTTVIPANGSAGLTLRFTPPRPGDYRAIAELQGSSYAGVVLTGKAVPRSATVSAPTITPRTIDPGAAITLSYTLEHPDLLDDIAGVQLEGLPPNTPGGSTQPVSLPQIMMNGSGRATQQIRIGPPAMDGVYPLTLRVRHKAAADTVVALGDLTVRDVPASIDHVVIRPDSHSRSQCELPLVMRTLEYRVSDNNGAADVYAPRIDQIQPPENSQLLISTSPPIPLASPTNWNMTTETVTSSVDLNCAARAQTWTLIVNIDEDDKTVRPPTQLQRFRKPLNYTVNP